MQRSTREEADGLGWKQTLVEAAAAVKWDATDADASADTERWKASATDFPDTQALFVTVDFYSAYTETKKMKLLTLYNYMFFQF